MNETNSEQDSTRDYYFRRTQDPKYRDATGQTYVDQRLDDKWKAWLKSFMRTRLDYLEDEIEQKLRDLKRENDRIQKDQTLSAQRRRRLDDRYVLIKRAWSSTGTATTRISSPSPW